MRESRRVVAYDALRVFAIVTVVAIHTLMPYRATLPAHAPVRVFDDLLHYAVPLFVFISGYFLWSRPWQATAGAYRAFLARRVSVIGIPYLAWSAIYLALLASTTELPLTPGRIIGLLLTGHTWYHLYFLPMLLAFYLLTPIAARIATRSPEALLAATYTLRIFAGPVVAQAVRPVLGDLGWSFTTHVFTHLPHMALGAWFALRVSRIPRHPLIALSSLTAGTAILTAASLDATRVLPSALQRLVYPGGMGLTLIGLVCVALLLEPVFERHAVLIARAGALSFGVYFVHPLILLAIERLVESSHSEQIWMRPWFPIGVFVVTTALSFAISARLPASTPAGASRGTPTGG